MLSKFRLENLKRPLGRSRHRWEYNIEMDLKEIVLDSVDWIHVAQNRNRWHAFVKMVNESLDKQ
jgi:hypothetical protein